MIESEDRDRSLERVRSTYRSYEREGRPALSDPSNRGYRRLAEDRDQALLDLLRGALLESSGRAFLDVGCGTGWLAGLIDATDPSVAVTGVDLLPERLAVAGERAPRATFVECSADEMPFEAETFDLAAAVTMFSSLPSPGLERAVAQEIGRVLRPGGWLIWYDIRYRNPWNAGVHAVPRRRLDALFPGWQSQLRSFSLLPPIARRLGLTTPILYPLLEAIPPLRSHLIGRLQCPT